MDDHSASVDSSGRTPASRLSHPASRLVLFDIDGTILSTDGAAKRAFHRAMLEVFAGAGPIEGHDFSGKTDPQIARELLTLHGLGTSEIDAGLVALWSVYLRELEAELARPEHRSVLMPGVVALLDALADRHGDVLVGLLTGNIEPGARLKLASVGLADRFAFGAYGSDAERRDALPAVAIARAEHHCGRRFQGEDVVVVGDTPHDVTCGRALGVRALAVATGRHSPAQLTAAGADIVLDDLSDTAHVLNLLTRPLSRTGRTE
ncbi:MAG: HAD family hydrolase [Longimicrobiales bacterium]